MGEMGEVVEMILDTTERFRTVWFLIGTVFMAVIWVCRKYRLWNKTKAEKWREFRNKELAAFHADPERYRFTCLETNSYLHMIQVALLFLAVFLLSGYLEWLEPAIWIIFYMAFIRLIIEMDKYQLQSKIAKGMEEEQQPA